MLYRSAYTLATPKYVLAVSNSFPAFVFNRHSLKHNFIRVYSHSNILEADTIKPLAEWNALLADNRKEAMSKKKQLYDFYSAVDKSDLLKHKKLALGLLDVVKQVPPNEQSLNDLKFALLVIHSLGNQNLLYEIFNQISYNRTDFDILLQYLISLDFKVENSEPVSLSLDDVNSSGENKKVLAANGALDNTKNEIDETQAYLKGNTIMQEKCLTYLRIIGAGCAYTNINFNNIGTQKLLYKVFEQISLLFTTRDLELSLEKYMRINSVAASSLCTIFLRVCTEAAISSSSAPTPTETSYNFLSGNNLPSAIWKLKYQLKVVNEIDLKYYMTFLIYQRQSQQVLELYDQKEMKRLHGVETIQPLLLASAACGDYSRLQEIFEEIDSSERMNKKYSNKLGSQWYGTILQALGYLGGQDVLAEVLHFIKKERPELLTRGLYHALIIGYGVRGELNKVLEHFYEQVKLMKPDERTFTLVLKSYRDAKDLGGALEFLQSEMLPLFPMTNKILAILLTLCGRRSDTKQAEVIWKWANKLIEPDGRSKSHYIYALVRGNEFQKAIIVLNSMNDEDISINVLTVLLQAASRSSNPTEWLNKIVKIKSDLEIPGDDGYYAAYLSFLSEQTNDISLLDEVFKEMEANKIAVNASHLASYTQALANTKKINRYKRVTKKMNDEHIPQRLSLISKQLRLLTAPGSSNKDRILAKNAAFDLLKSGFFDPQSIYVPRNIIPLRVIKPVIIYLIDSFDFTSARELLSMVTPDINKAIAHQRKANSKNSKNAKNIEQRKSKSSVPSVPSEDTKNLKNSGLDNLGGMNKSNGNSSVQNIQNCNDYNLWSLWMRYSLKSGDTHNMPQYWFLFKTAIRSHAVLHQPDADTPVYKLNRRFRYQFHSDVDKWIRYLHMVHDKTKLKGLTQELFDIGIELTGNNYNRLIYSFLSEGLLNEATALAKKRLYPLKPFVYTLLSYKD